jgi:hypothetical protein
MDRETIDGAHQVTLDVIDLPSLSLHFHGAAGGQSYFHVLPIHVSDYSLGAIGVTRTGVVRQDDDRCTHLENYFLSNGNLTDEMLLESIW